MENQDPQVVCLLLPCLAQHIQMCKCLLEVKKLFVCSFSHSKLMVVGYVIAHAVIPVPFGVRAEVTTDNTSIRVSWKWSCQGVLDHVRVHYPPEGGSLMVYTVDNTTVTSATLPNLQCNTKYTVWVHARSGGTGRKSLSRTVSLPARGTCMY